MKERGDLTWVREGGFGRSDKLRGRSESVAEGHWYGRLDLKVTRLKMKRFPYTPIPRSTLCCVSCERSPFDCCWKDENPCLAWLLCFDLTHFFFFFFKLDSLVVKLGLSELLKFKSETKNILTFRKMKK